MKRMIKTGLAALGVAAMATGAWAQDWTPPGPIKLLIGFRAGGGADTQARLIAEALEQKNGWKFIPEQVTGKGGLNLAAALKDAPNDGTVIGLAVTETFGYNMAASRAGMTPEDYTGLSTTAGFQMGIVTRKETGWTSFDDMIAAARGGQDIRFGVMSPKLADLAYLLGKAQGVAFNIVSVKGGKAVMDGVNAGDLDVGFMAGIQAKGVAAGDLVNLASALSQPLVQTPEAPTMADLGVDFSADGYFVFVGPAGMPDAARDALAKAIAGVVSDESSKAGGLIVKAFGGAAVITGDDLTALMAKDYAEAADLLKAASE
ncbi:MAG: tripartite tricarboxylate transporter substrate-binding protein [Antarcticimicrobium sp.]|uniref:Bug family tripartite tricarboxylate transporter substrate binding protein n=1 Tax=Antarcticimicrobium sp. TaxID=2824147 RepID=UPI00262FAD9B|nr:tripartite tricarboxylate transporter substrate-binding protein [Antarcticimicrobium sp.]MDF1717348.1 tripartite tricarboxylate transporter substrate-binding protein [Antarcticimicrobium sp.]